MKRKIASLVLLLVSAVMINAHAASTKAKSDEEAADNSYLQNGRGYVLGNIGYGTIDAGPTANSPQGGFAWNVGAGYLWHRDAFGYGVELSFNSFPGVPYSNSSINGNSVNIAAVGEFAVTEVWHAIGKVGPGITTQTYNSSSSTRVMPTVYLGGAYKLTKNIDLNAGYEYVAGAIPMYAILRGVIFNF